MFCDHIAIVECGVYQHCFHAGVRIAGRDLQRVALRRILCIKMGKRRNIRLAFINCMGDVAKIGDGIAVLIHDGQRRQTEIPSAVDGIFHRRDVGGKFLIRYVRGAGAEGRALQALGQRPYVVVRQASAVVQV